MGGQLAGDVDHALRNVDNAPHALSCIAGLGGRPVTRSALREAIPQGQKEPWEGMYFLDLESEGRERGGRAYELDSAVPDRPPKTSCADIRAPGR